MNASPKDYVAVGQSFLDRDADLYTVTAVRRVWSDYDRRERWDITVMCVISTKPWFRAGGTSELASYDGTLRTHGYTRVG
jgi:hypothetical protein